LGGKVTDSIAVGRVSQPESERDREEGEGTLRSDRVRGKNRDQPKLIIRLENDLREDTGYKEIYMKRTVDRARELKRQW